MQTYHLLGLHIVRTFNGSRVIAEKTTNKPMYRLLRP